MAGKIVPRELHMIVLAFCAIGEREFEFAEVRRKIGLRGQHERGERVAKTGNIRDVSLWEGVATGDHQGAQFWS